MKIKAIVGYVTNSKRDIVEDVTVITTVCTSGHDGNGEPGTEELAVVRNQYGDLGICSMSNAYLGNTSPALVTFVQGADTVNKMAKLLILLAKQLEDGEQHA